MPHPSSPAAIAQARAIVELLAGAHGVAYDHDTLDATARRLAAAAPPPGVTGAIDIFAAEAGLAVARVRRSLREVVDDADPSMPWVAVRQHPDGAADAIAVLDRQRGGARVAVPGAHDRPGRWSLASLRAWLGVAGDHDVMEWLLAEPAAPLAGMRSVSPETRRLPFSRIRALLAAERRTLWVAVVYSAVIGLLSLVVPIAVQLLVNTIAFGSLLQPLAVLMLVVFVALGFSTALNALRAAVVEIIQKSIFARVATDVT